MACPFRPNRIVEGAARGTHLRAAARFPALPLSALLCSCAGGTSGSTGTPATPAATVSVVPPTVTVATSATAQFVATVQNTPVSTVQWEVNRIAGGNVTMGTITATGLYRAPAIVPGTTVKITAALQEDTNRFGSADVTVVPPVSLSPRQAALTTSQTLQFQAGGPGVSNATVNWAASGGSVSASGLYTPPPATAGIFTVTATSRSDPTASAAATIYATKFAGLSSWRNDPGLTGQNLQELALNPATLAAGLFGKISFCAVDGQIYAQPLYIASLTDGSRIRNVVYVATQHDSVYAFDADAVPCQQVWKRSFLDDATGVTPVPALDVLGSDISPEIGITGTPVIDRTSGTLYVVARTKENTPLGLGYAQRLHALDIVTGSEKFGSPVAISAIAPGIGDGSNGTGQVPFDPLIENQRAALQLAGGKVYVAFGGHGQANLFHGWLLVYDAATLQQTGVFNTTPNGSRGGIGQSGAGPSADAAGNVFVATSRGTFDASPPPFFRKNFGQTLLKLQSNPILNIADFFTPFNQELMTIQENDFGSSGVLILPDQNGAPNPRLAVIGAEHGVLYLLNRDSLGGFTSSPAPNQLIKTLSLSRIFGTPAYWQNTLYVAAVGDALKAFSLAGGTFAGAPSSQSSAIFASPGASPAVSSNGATGGIVWTLDTSGADSTPAGPVVLRAYDATNLARELFSSAQKPENAAGPAVRLAVPTVANGKVYVGTQNELTVYGLLP